MTCLHARGCLDRQKTVPSLMTLSGGEPSARRARAMRAAGRPGAAFEDFRASGSAAASMPSRCRTGRASRSSSATVSARHSTTSGEATSCCARARRPRSRKHEHAGIDEQAAVAVFGEPGEAVDIGHRRSRRAAAARSANRPAIATACAAAPARWSRRRSRAPDAASSRRAGRRRASAATARSARDAAAARRGSLAPAIAPPPARALQDDRTGRRAAACRCGRTRPAARPRARRARRSRSARPSRPTSGLSLVDLQAACQVAIGRESARRSGIGAQRVVRIGRKSAAREHVEAGERQALRSGRWPARHCIR